MAKLVLRRQNIPGYASTPTSTVVIAINLHHLAKIGYSPVDLRPSTMRFADLVLDRSTGIVVRMGSLEVYIILILLEYGTGTLPGIAHAIEVWRRACHMDVRTINLDTHRQSSAASTLVRGA